VIGARLYFTFSLFYFLFKNGREPSNKRVKWIYFKGIVRDMPISLAYSDTIWMDLENGRSMKDVFTKLERDRLDSSDRSRQ